ncbi:MAG: tetratricopeptide repeat protein [Anaerolineales bacterium]
MIENEDTFRKAIELNPENASAYYKLGMVLTQDTTRLGEAESAYYKAIELEPNNAQYIYRLGLLLHENLHRLKDAEAAYRKAITLAPDDPFFYSGLISLLVQQSRQAEAVPFSTKMRMLLNAAENWYGLATLDAILGNTEAALEHLRQAARNVNFNYYWARNDPDLS